MAEKIKGDGNIGSEYSEMAVMEQELAIDLPDGEQHKSFSERLEESPNLTDMQSALIRLFPDNLGSSIANSAMIARIAPDVFLPLLRLMTVSDVMRSDPRKPINTVDTLLKNYTLLSIGLDGKGRIDQIELAGASRDDKELENMSKGLF